MPCRKRQGTGKWDRRLQGKKNRRQGTWEHGTWENGTQETVTRTLRTGDGMTKAGTGRKDGKIGQVIGTQGGDSRTGYKRKGIKARERGEKTRGKREQRMVRVREDWRWEKRGRRTGKQSKADRDRKMRWWIGTRMGIAKENWISFMGMAAFIYQIQKKTLKRIEVTGKKVRRKGNQDRRKGNNGLGTKKKRTRDKGQGKGTGGGGCLRVGDGG